MIIDDSSTMRKIVGLALKTGHYEYIEAENGKDALNKLTNESKIDLFVVDIDMPEMNGIEFIQNIKKDPKFNNVPILVLTTHTDEKIHGAATEAGANAWIVKPFEKTEFLNIIKGLI
jgi:two-component system chemotaxis response regulator CheY